MRVVVLLLVLVPVFFGCLASQSIRQADTELKRETEQSKAQLEYLRKESESRYEPTAEGEAGEVSRDFDSGVKHYYRKYGAWETTRIEDHLRPKPQILVCSRFIADQFDNGRSRLCFRFLSATHVSVEPQALSGKGYWPYCEFDYIQYRVDENKPSVFPTKKLGGGLCSDILDTRRDDFIEALEKGATLFAQLHYSRGKVQLTGFKDAWSYAISRY